MSVRKTVDIPAAWLAQQQVLPDRCVQHGLPAVRRTTFAVRSNPTIGSRKKVFQPGYTSLNRADEYVRQVKFVKVTGWPLCQQCVRRRTLGLALASVLLFGGLLVMIGGFVVATVGDGPNKALLIPILVGFAAVLVSPLPFRWASLLRLSQAEVTTDGAAVQVHDASQGFTRQLPGPASDMLN